MFFINPTVVPTSLAHFEERLLKNDPGGLHDQVRHSRADPEKRIDKARLQYHRGVATCTQIRNCVPENNNKK